jgi:porin
MLMVLRGLTLGTVVRHLIQGLCILFVCSLFTLAKADEAPAEAPSGWHHGLPFAYEKGLLGPLGGKRAALAEKGVNVHLSLLTVGQSVVDGGTGTDENEISGSYDLQVYLDSQKLGLWEGGFGLIRFEGTRGNPGVNPGTGAVIPVNFDAVVPETNASDAKPTEWWYAQEVFGGKAEGLAGMWDIARFFDISPFSGPYHYRFLNSHMFFNSVLLPFAPYNKLGGVVTLKPVEWLTITTGLADPNSSADDVDWFEEGDFDILHEWRVMAKPFGKPGMFAVGIAYKDQEQATIAQDGGATDTTNSDQAFYGNFNQWLYQNPDNPHQAIGMFGRIGITDGDVNLIERHYSVGFSFDGMIPSRPKDVFGIVGWHNDFSDDLAGTLDDSSEGFEAYYRFQVTPWFQVSPDVQYLIDPGITQGADDAVVLGLRGLVHF